MRLNNTDYHVHSATRGAAHRHTIATQCVSLLRGLLIAPPHRGCPGWVDLGD